MSNSNEIWLPVNGFERLYEVSNLGRVKRLARRWAGGFHKERILKAGENKTGYRRGTFYRGGTGKALLINRLVAIAFIPNPKNKPMTNHKNGIKTDNRVENLEWATAGENQKHAYRTGLRKPSYKKVAQIKNGKIVKIWKSLSEASCFSGIDSSNISSSCYGRYKHAGDFQWKFT